MFNLAKRGSSFFGVFALHSREGGVFVFVFVFGGGTGTVLTVPKTAIICFGSRWSIKEKRELWKWSTYISSGLQCQNLILGEKAQDKFYASIIVLARQF